MNLRRSLALGIAALSAACGAAAGAGGPGEGTGIGTSTQALEALVPMASCGEVETFLRERLIADEAARIDARIELVTANEYDVCNYRYGSSSGDYENDSAMSPPSQPSAGSSSSSSGSSGSSGSATTGAGDSAKGASQTSKTNNQTAGVDEADFVKNDDKFLYVVANGALQILQAWPANEAHQVAKVPLEGEPKKLFVEGNRALVYLSVPRAPVTTVVAGESGSSGSSSSGGSGAVWSGSSSGGSSSSSSSSSCSYGYDCVPSGDGFATKLVVFDITNRAAPVRIRELEASGSLLSARRLGNAVHTVLVDESRGVAGLKGSPEVETSCTDGSSLQTRKARTIAAWQALRAKNLEALAKADVLATLPTVKEGGGPAVPACSGYFRPNLAEGATFTTLLSLDLLAGGAPTAATIVSDPGVIYASDTALYMSVPHRRKAQARWYPSMEGEEEASLVHQFRIGEAPSLTGYAASGIVKGRVLNQFALDEHDAHLRIATTTGHTPSPKVHSTMSILERKGQALVLSGKLDQIAPTEDIRSVRFDGSRGFVVTFKKTDPLFVFDLGDPSAPKMAGELKIPGFSTYMHMMDAQHLLTIGYDADDQGDFAWFAGVMLQIFDVSDMRNPKLAHKEVIGTRGSSSEALTNHLAFTYYAPKHLLALPMSICEGGEGGSYGTNLTFSGLMVYDVTAEGGFHRHGQVAHPNTSTGTGYDSSACSNWWTNARSEVKRSVIMDDFVYSVSDRRVKVNGLANLSRDLSEVSLENPGWTNPNQGSSSGGYGD